MARRHPDCAERLDRQARPEHQDAFLATIVIAALGRPVFGNADADQEFLAAALSNDDAAVRRAALEALAVLGDARGVGAASFALADEETEVRNAAVHALARMRDEAGAVAGLDQLIELATTSQDERLVVAAVRALGDTGDSRVLEVLWPLARAGSPVAAVAAVEALGSLDDSRHVDALIDALGHEDSEVVKAALAALDAHRDPRVVTHFGACMDHPSWSVRRLAADLLGQVGGDAAAALLRAKLNSEEEPLVREAIQRALGAPEITRTPLRPTPIPGLGSWPPR
jgi:HEAT repeat protein